MELRIAIFASGKGSNCKAIIEAVNKGQVPNAKVVLVVSNNKNAGALDIARSAGIPSVWISRQSFDSDEEFNNTLLKILNEYQVNFIALAGYLKKLDSVIIQQFRNRIVNIHPALLPAFGGKGMYGIHVHEAVLASGEKITGATVHIVDEEYDHGPIILQETINVLPDDTPESLAERVLPIEHRLYPKALRLFAEDRVKIDKQQVIILQEQ